MITATYVRQYKYNSSSSDARIYRLSEPIPYGRDYETDKPQGETNYVMVSATVVPGQLGGGPETYIFPANAKGEVVNWLELPGSFKGRLDHREAIKRAGWTLNE